MCHPSLQRQLSESVNLILFLSQSGAPLPLAEDPHSDHRPQGSFLTLLAVFHASGPWHTLVPRPKTLPLSPHLAHSNLTFNTQLQAVRKTFLTPPSPPLSVYSGLSIGLSGL